MVLALSFIVPCDASMWTSFADLMVIVLFAASKVRLLLR